MKRQLKTLASACMFIAAGCVTAETYAEQSQPITPAADSELLISRSRDAVKLELKDPESAQFSGERKVVLHLPDNTIRSVVCGQVNAKNEFGGFAGPTLFIYDDAKRTATIMTKENHRLFMILHESTCREQK